MRDFLEYRSHIASYREDAQREVTQRIERIIVTGLEHSLNNDLSGWKMLQNAARTCQQDFYMRGKLSYEESTKGRASLIIAMEMTIAAGFARHIGHPQVMDISSAREWHYRECAMTGRVMYPAFKAMYAISRMDAKFGDSDLGTVVAAAKDEVRYFTENMPGEASSFPWLRPTRDVLYDFAVNHLKLTPQGERLIAESFPVRIDKTEKGFKAIYAPVARVA